MPGYPPGRPAQIRSGTGDHPASRGVRSLVPAGSPTPGSTTLQSQALMTAAREPPNLRNFALVAMFAGRRPVLPMSGSGFRENVGNSRTHCLRLIMVSQADNTRNADRKASERSSFRQPHSFGVPLKVVGADTH